MNDNRLLINPHKSKVMFFGSLQSDAISVVIRGRPVEVVDSFDCLGVILDNRLKFELHINSLTSKVNFILRKLYNLDMALPRNIKTQVVHALIMPVFLYGLEVYSGTLGYVMKKFNLLFNRVIRYIFSVRKHQHISNYVDEFLGCSFLQFVNMRSVIHFYKIMSTRAPLFLLEMFKFGRSARNMHIVIPRLSSWMDRSFIVRVARLYNTLPNSLKTFDCSVDTFKKNLAHFVKLNT